MKTLITAILIIVAAAVLGFIALLCLAIGVAGDIMKGFEEWDGGRNDAET